MLSPGITPITYRWELQLPLLRHVGHKGFLGTIHLERVLILYPELETDSN